MKTLGIILAAGNSTRLYPATFPVTKQLLPVFDKPLAYYPLTTLMLAGIRDLIIIVSPSEEVTWLRFWKQTGLDKAIHAQFLVQEKPTGIPDAFNIANDPRYNTPGWFDQYDKIVLILGDNLFHGATLTGQIQNAINQPHAAIFAHKVTDLHRFGVINVARKPYEITEKPAKIEDLKNSYAIPGLYVFPTDVFGHAKELKASKRGETEITDLITHYRNYDRLHVEVLHRGVAWFDTGTPEALLDAAQYVKSVQTNQGFLIGSPHEVALRNDWIDAEELFEWTKSKGNGDYVRHVLREMALD